MEPTALIRSLEHTGPQLLTAFEGIGPEAWRWRPAPEKWSLLEILVHLVDEERDDFRHRVTLTLEDPETPWPPIDPEAWVKERDYDSRDPSATLDELRREREDSLSFLIGLAGPDWTRAYVHPLMGSISAGDLLAAWAAHDLLHLRQIATTRLAWLEDRSKPWSTRYAMP